jgi:hypothetical protein
MEGMLFLGQLDANVVALDIKTGLRRLDQSAGPNRCAWKGGVWVTG